jgi:hypothetical protein
MYCIDLCRWLNEAPRFHLGFRRWCGECIDPILRCFNNSEALNYGDLPSQCSSQVHELANGIRLGTTVLSQDLSGAWVTIHG